MENFGKFMAIVLAMIISPIINGFVIVKLWSWFIVPTFEIQSISIVEAIGLMFLVNYLKTNVEEKNEGNDFWGKFAYRIAFVVGMSCFALLSGWIVQMFI